MTIITAVGIGSIAAAIITFYGNKWLQARQQTGEMAKQKIDVISKSQPKFFQLAIYYGELATHLADNDRDTERTFFATCKLFLLRNCIFEEFGIIQLDNLEAEGIVFGFGEYISLKFNYLDLNLMQNLVETYPRYNQFKEKIFEDNELYERFKEFLSRLGPQNCRAEVQMV